MPFPFTDLSQSKPRPTLVIAELQGHDLILCQITSKDYGSDRYAISLIASDFVRGGLQVDSFIRPNRVFTASTNVIKYSAGLLKPDKFNEVIARLKEIVDGRL